MKVSYDPHADAVYLRFAKGKAARTEEVRDGIILDYDEAGRIAGIEILHASQTLPESSLKDISRQKS
jgi:uncharacterized protein YuzE